MTQEGEKQQILPFHPVDAVLQTVEEQMRLQPERKAELKLLMNTPLAQVANHTIAIRCEDIGLAMKWFFDGRIPNDEAYNKRFISYGDLYSDYYYISLLWGNPYWDKVLEGKASPPQVVEQYYAEINSRRTDYSNIAFNTAFSTQVVPTLPKDWIQHARRTLVENGHEDTENNRETLAYHDYLHQLQMELSEAQGNGLTAASIYKSRTTRRPFIQKLLQQVDIASMHDYEHVYKYLQHTNQTRGGIIIGYNANVLQGNWVNHHMYESEHYDENEITGCNQIAIRTEKGYIDLSRNPITAIEVFGEYEEEIKERFDL